MRTWIILCTAFIACVQTARPNAPAAAGRPGVAPAAGELAGARMDRARVNRGRRGEAAAAGASSEGPSQSLVWSDEFNGAAGSLPDPANWNLEVGGGGWGNGELEC